MSNRRSEILGRVLGSLSLRKRSPEFKRSLTNAVMNSGEGLLSPILWLVSTPFFVAMLGDSQFGIWMLVNGFIGVGGVLSFGLTEATIKFVSKYRALNDQHGVLRVFRATLLVYLLLGVVGAVLALALAPIIGQWVFKNSADNSTLGLIVLRMGGLGILLRFIDNVFQSVLQGFERYDINSKVGMVINVATVGTNLGLVLAGFGLVTLLGVTLGFIFLGTVLKALALRRTVMPYIRFGPACDRATFRELMSFGFYNWLQHALGLVNGNLDRFLIAGFLSPAAVTYYAVCFQLITQIHYVLMRAAAFLFPMSSALFEKGDDQRLRQIYHKASRLIALLATTMVIPVYVLGDSLLKIWMGADFADQASLILRIFCVRMILMPFGIVNYYFLLGSGLVRFQALIVCLTAPVNFLGMFLLIPEYGGLGAALAQLLNLPFMIFSRFFVEKKLFNEINPLRNAAYLFPAAVPFVGATLLIFYAPLAAGNLLSFAVQFSLVTLAGSTLSCLVALMTQRLRWLD